MKRLYLFPLLLFGAFTPPAFAGWKCSNAEAASEPQYCAAAGTQATPEQFASLYVDAVRQAQSSAYKTNFKVDSCSFLADTLASCGYSWTSYGSPMSNSVSAQKEAVSCPDTVEVRGPNAAAIKSGDKYYVAWSVSSVTADVCHNSCSYLASSASGSTCYLSTGSTDTGFCNFVVGLNSASPSCGAESGYTAPSVGDPLTPSTDPGDGGGDGSNPGGGGDGDGGNGGDGDSGFDGELSFDNPGALDGAAILGSEVNAVHYDAFVRGMEADLNESGFGKALTEFNEKMAAGGSQAACPTADVYLLGTMITFDAHCALFDSVSSILAAALLAAWSILALRVFLSA